MKEERIVDEASRVETLEIKVSHLGRAIQELSDVVYRQSRLWTVRWR